ncbi:MAG: protease inhibitor I9 family protein [Burkholderiales bacterium]|jgi:hypothetical protein|nr:protease inhibitor I9 family protein [Burkholderiales bacterium]
MLRAVACVLVAAALGGCADSAATSEPEPFTTLRVLTPACASPAPLLGQPHPRAPSVIVIFRAGVAPLSETARLAAKYGFTPTHTYVSALSGFAAQVTSETLARLRCESSVELIEHDQVVTIAR